MGYSEELDRESYGLPERSVSSLGPASEGAFLAFHAKILKSLGLLLHNRTMRRSYLPYRE